MHGLSLTNGCSTPVLSSGRGGGGGGGGGAKGRVTVGVHTAADVKSAGITIAGTHIVGGGGGGGGGITDPVVCL